VVENIREFLRGLLADGPVASKQIRGAAEKAGLAWRTVQRAQKAMDIEAYREGFGKAGAWYWRLAKNAIETKQRDVAKAEPTEDEQKARRDRELSGARFAMSPSVNAASVIEDFSAFSNADMVHLAVQLGLDIKDINNNDMRGCEAMLYSQAQALQAIFVSLASQARNVAEEWFPNFEVFMRLAFKAQSQCVRTLETLAQYKNPPVLITRQANIAQGPQQVNNGMMPAGQPRAGAGKTEKPQNKLSGGSNELLPDPRTPGAAVGSDPAMATLGTFDRAKVRRR
jgi:hypothetical protein